MGDIDTVMVDSLKALDPERPIREADIIADSQNDRFRNVADCAKRLRLTNEPDLFADMRLLLNQQLDTSVPSRALLIPRRLSLDAVRDAGKSSLL